MDFDLSEEQHAISGLAQEFATRRMLPQAAEWDENKIFPADTLREAAALGLAGIYCRGEYGGSDLGRLDAVLIFEELARACPSTAAYISIHNMVGWMIDQFGKEEQRQQLLPKLMSMEHFAGYCLTEPGAGSDAASLRASANREGDHYIINGEKSFVSGGSISDIYLCMLRTGGDGPKGISCIVVEKDAPGLSFGALEQKLGWNSQPTASVIFDGCKVPVANLIGAEGDGFSIAMMGLDGGRLNIGACSLGGAGAAIDLAKSYMLERRQFGQKLSEFQALQFRLANMASELESARLMIHKAAWMLDHDKSGSRAAVAMAKRVATDAGFSIVNDALQLHGGYGYLKPYGVERYLRDLRVHQILEGTNEIMQVIVARDLLRQ